MTPTRYPKALRLVHWARALVVLGTLGVGTVMTLLDEDVLARFDILYPSHKQLGVLAFILAVLQLLLRRGQQVPPLPQRMPSTERLAARLGHGMLYVLLLAVPLVGYGMSSVFPHSDGVPFLTFMLPELLPKSELWFGRLQWAHKVLAYTLLALIAMHIAAALKHRFVDADPELDVLKRMW